ncbi:sensor histidine kinase [Paenibacillus alkalitolerans]|uniref:sensor histidine kinase n=1 Tax=Paenibacillus alkalitolerans TaxID=2799335 RepID=UPI0018F5FA2E|nr:sensor histidine kinase [Paenibacillus alkalitolerans]
MGFIKSMYEYFSLKRRITILFVASSIIPFIGIGLISYYTIDSILTNKIQSAIQSNVKQVQLSLQNTFNNLNHVSQQLAIQGTVGKKLDKFLTENEPYERSRLVSDIKSDLAAITFTNPNIGLTMYYFKDDGTTLFENLPVKKSFAPDKHPLLAEYYGISYYGPHISNGPFTNQYVLSALRKVDLPDRDDVYVYIETGLKLTQNILETDRIGENVFFLILDNDGRIAYSEVPDVFPQNAVFKSDPGKESSGVGNGYFWYKRTGNQGWSIVSVVPEAEYNKEKNRWMMQTALFSLLVLAISLVLAWLLWKMVYRPLTKFHNEIKWAGQSNFHSESAKTNIPEFDYLLNQFQKMKQQIRELFAEVERKEKRRADLEIEKLLYQINPHFLMNTLDTAHWLAVMNGQNEIDRLIVSLNKLLYYNLGKLGEHSTVREELDALREYVTLQQIRYDFKFDVRIDAEEHVLDMTIPRFILQPLVENALYHGLDDKGHIHVEVKYNDRIEIAVRDNGAGIPVETVERLLNNEQAEKQKVGMGIGMNYVKRMLEAHYNGEAKMEIESEIGRGTTVSLRLPVREVSEA